MTRVTSVGARSFPELMLASVFRMGRLGMACGVGHKNWSSVVRSPCAAASRPWGEGRRDRCVCTEHGVGWGLQTAAGIKERPILPRELRTAMMRVLSSCSPGMERPGAI